MGILSKLRGRRAKAQAEAVAPSVADIAEQRRAADERKQAQDMERLRNEWAIVREHEPEPYMEVPTYDLGNRFPFSDRPYVCLVHVRLDRETGEVYDADRAWYADEDAIRAFSADLGHLEDLLAPEVVGIPSLPSLRTDLRLAVPLAAPVLRDRLPQNSVRLMLRPYTPTGRKARYPVSVAFSAYADYTPRTGRGSHGVVSYLGDGSVGKAVNDYWSGSVHYRARFRLSGGVISLGSLTYDDDPEGRPVTIYPPE